MTPDEVQTGMTVAEWFEKAGLVGIIFVLGAILYGGAKEWWVYGRHYREVVEQRDRLQAIVNSLAQTASKAVELAEKK